MYSYNVHIFYVCVLYIVLYVFMWVRIQIFFVWNCPSQSPLTLTTFMWCFPLFSITKWGLYNCHYTYIQLFLAFYSRYIFSPHSFPFYCLGSALFCAVLLRCFYELTIHVPYDVLLEKQHFMGISVKLEQQNIFCVMFWMSGFLYIASLTLLPRLTRAAGIFCH